MSGTGSGEEAEDTTAAELDTFFIVRDFQPGQLVKIVFLTVEQSQSLPHTIPADALQIIVAPGGGI